MTTHSNIDILPVAPLKIIAMNNCRQLGEQVSEILHNISFNIKKQ